jgi:glucose-6-phosphate isomerase
MTIADTREWKALSQHAEAVRHLHLRDLLEDPRRCQAMRLEQEGLLFDYSRQLATRETMDLLFGLARAAKVPEKVRAMASGARINATENRSVLHLALRAAESDGIVLDGVDVVPEVHDVLRQIRRFSDEVRKGKRRGATGKKLTSVISIGIGGSYLGPEFVAEALRTEPACARAARGRALRFLANVDPIDVARALEGLDPETTLVVIVSKTFTTAETILNAKTVRQWLVKKLGKAAVARHMVAVSTNLKDVEAFGIDPKNAFGFWDWVGGRYSVCSAVGVLPLSLHYGFEAMEEFLAGARDLDAHFLTAPLEENLPVLLGLLSVWNVSFLDLPVLALLPYCQALLRFPAHIQQVEMESNGKRVLLDGASAPFPTGGMVFGEPGTNGQHSFYQLLHQGRVVPADFIGFCRSQRPSRVRGETVDNHDELMANFFAQPDALALGKTEQECRSEGVPDSLVPHKVFPGNRPSNALLFDALTPFSCGQLLALYEHRTAVQGFVWGLNSFDQWGVELGKVLAKQVRAQLGRSRESGAKVVGFNPSTTAAMQRYLRESSKR